MQSSHKMIVEKDSTVHLQNHIYKIFKKNLPHISFTENIHVLVLSNLYEENLVELREKTKKSKVTVLVISCETMTFSLDSSISQELVKFTDLLKKFGIFNCDFYITSCFTNQNIKTIKSLNKNFYDWKFYDFYIDYPCNVNFELLKVLDYNNVDLFLEKSVMKFSHLNFTHRMHRKLFSKFIIKENLLENNLVAINPPRTYSTTSLDLTKKNNLIPINVVDDWFYNKNLLNLYKDVELVYKKHPNIDDNIDSPYVECFHNSAINIISESVFNYPFQYFTEKTISSLLSKRPFILIGPHNSLEYLKNSGYKTFDTIFDESYDQISDPNIRLETIMQLVLDLNKKTQDELNEMVYGIKDILIHNYKLMLNKFRVFTNV